MKNLIAIAVVVAVFAATLVPSTAFAEHCRLSRGNRVSIGSGVSSHQVRSFGNAFHSNNFSREFIVSTFIDGAGNKIGVTNFGNEVLIQRNVRLSDSRFFGLNSRRVGGFNNGRVSSVADRVLGRTADILLLKAILD